MKYMSAQRIDRISLPAAKGARHRRLICRTPAKRGGAILIAVMVAITIAMLLLTSWLRTTAIARRQTNLAESRAQVQWLAEAGLERAAAQLARNAEYQGETWSPAKSDPRLEGGQVVIRIEPIANRADRRLVRLKATLGGDRLTRAQKSKQAIVSIVAR